MAYYLAENTSYGTYLASSCRILSTAALILYVANYLQWDQTISPVGLARISFGGVRLVRELDRLAAE
jgi:hypothetical protein